MTRELAADVVIVGGGTAGCMAAVAAKEARPDLRVLIVEKAAIDRSGCLAAGMNAINAYLHPGETPESYTRYARYDACGLVRAVNEIFPLEFSGLGSERLRGAGVNVVHDYKHISLTGLSELLSKAGDIWQAYSILKRHLLEVSPALLILVDFPGFNLRIARLAKRLGIPTVYFIPPQVWAWRKRRIDKIKAYTDLVLCILPFEEALYREHAIPVSYVGHPYVRTVKPVHTKNDFCVKFGIHRDTPLITVMPGSRHNEAGKHMPVLIKVIELLEKRLGDLTVLLPVAPSMEQDFFDPFIRQKRNIIPIRGLPYDCLKFSDVALIASGSATLEAAILGTPSVVIYKVSPLSYYIARMLVRVKYISLPNIIAEKEIFPEFVQSLDAERIAETMVYMIKNDRSGIQKEMELVRNRLTVSSDPYQMAGEKIVQFLERLYGPLHQTP